MMPKTPPKTRNCETWSTSLVTRETRAPRCSVFWVSSGRSCTCRNALIRSVASPRSEAVNSRAVMKYDEIPVATIATAASIAIETTKETSTPSGPLMPRSRVCCMEMGTTSRPAVPTAASRSVQPNPSPSSGENASPRRIVSRAEISSPLSTLVPSAVSRAVLSVGRRASGASLGHPLGLVGVHEPWRRRGCGRAAAGGCRGRRCVRRRGRAPRRPGRWSPCGRRSASASSPRRARASRPGSAPRPLGPPPRWRRRAPAAAAAGSARGRARAAAADRLTAWCPAHRAGCPGPSAARPRTRRPEPCAAPPRPPRRAGRHPG